MRVRLLVGIVSCLVVGGGYPSTSHSMTESGGEQMIASLAIRMIPKFGQPTSKTEQTERGEVSLTFYPILSFDIAVSPIEIAWLDSYGQPEGQMDSVPSSLELSFYRQMQSDQFAPVIPETSGGQAMMHVHQTNRLAMLAPTGAVVEFFNALAHIGVSLIERSEAFAPLLQRNPVIPNFFEFRDLLVENIVFEDGECTITSSEAVQAEANQQPVCFIDLRYDLILSESAMRNAGKWIPGVSIKQRLQEVPRGA